MRSRGTLPRRPLVSHSKYAMGFFAAVSDFRVTAVTQRQWGFVPSCHSVQPFGNPPMSGLSESGQRNLVQQALLPNGDSVALGIPTD